MADTTEILEIARKLERIADADDILGDPVPVRRKWLVEAVRIFRKVYTINMLAEMPQDLVTQVWKVLRVFVPIVDRDHVDTYLSTILSDPVSGESVLDPIGTFTNEERVKAGEHDTYYNISANAAPTTAMATGVANATTSS